MDISHCNGDTTILFKVTGDCASSVFIIFLFNVVNLLPQECFSYVYAYISNIYR